jgi:eukaryotic translation initiation factor 2C
MLLKINQKAGGINWQLPVGPEVWAAKLGAAHLMVLGIDVGHGMAGGGGKKPSTAAVVGSLDSGCSRYGAVVLEQTAGEEIVLGLREAVQQLLRDRYSATSSGRQGTPAAGSSTLPRSGLPDSLLVYRDGVSDSQYVAVLQQEVVAIRQACMDAGGPNYRPKVTFVVVSKSHGTRLFPHHEDPQSSDASVGGKSGNVVPGTVVDTHITAPLKYEFFLNSHAGIQGTNRPARYNVLVDDAGLGPDGLQLVTQHLGSTYCACTRTISCPAPVRYADKAARIAAAAAGQASGWQVVQAATQGTKAREYRVLDMSRTMAGKMWFV